MKTQYPYIHNRPVQGGTFNEIKVEHEEIDDDSN